MIIDFTSVPIELINIRIKAKYLSQSLDWSAVRCRLLWYYRNAPHVRLGTFDTINVVIWRMLKGKVRLKFPDLELKAGPGDWVAMIRGVRTQEFSEDALIESIHLHFETAAAEWSGPAAAVFRESPGLREIAVLLRKIVPREASQGHHPPRKIRHVSDFAQQALLQGTVWRFCGTLIPPLKKAGIQLQAPEIFDPRVARSMTAIDSLPMDQTWDRTKIAQTSGVSVSQLDRLWTEERKITPWHYWDLRRLRYAKGKLENSDLPIKEIALELGFVHLAQFSNWFHGRQGISPRDYRSHIAR